MEVPQDPAANDTSGVLLVRKLRRKADWESKADRPEDRARDLFENLFRRDQLPYSFYQPGSECDLRRVALAMNAARRISSKLADEAFFIAFPHDVMEKIGLTITPTPGGTECRLVNRSHFDVTGTEDQFRVLLLEVLQSGQPPLHLSKEVMRQILDQAIAEQCRVVPQATGDCTVEVCPPVV